MKLIEGFAGYRVTEGGMVFSEKTNRYLKQKTQNSGYLIVILTTGRKQVTQLVHRLVAAAFIANPLGLKEVNHIDGNKTNNALVNLEWSDRSRNTKHSYEIGLREPQRIAVGAANKRRCSVAVVGTKISGGDTVGFESMTAAETSGFSHSKISLCVSGERKSHKGYTWKAA